jgi:hypothetical protein
MRPVWAAVLALLVTALCLWVLLTPATLQALSRAFLDARLLPLIIAFVLVVLVQWARAWRFSIMTTGVLALPSWLFLRIALQLNFMNFVLPFRLGELSYPVLMKHHFEHGLLHSAGVLMLARLFDLAAVLAMLLGAAAVLGLGGGSVGNTALVLGAAACGLAPFALLLGGHALRPRIKQLPHLGSAAAKLTAGLDALRDRTAAMSAVALGWAIWLLLGAAAILVAGAVTATVSPPAALLGSAAGSIAFALPVNGIAGIGPAQAAWVAATTHIGVPWDDAVVSSLALHAVVLMNAVVLGALASIPDLAGRRRVEPSELPAGRK